MTRAELLNEIFKLREDEQAVLAQAIHDHLDRPARPVDEAAFKNELDRRVQAANNQPADAVSWEDLLRELRR